MCFFVIVVCWVLVFLWQDLVKDPRFFTGGASRFDVAQGMLGDCWLVAAIASLTQDKILFRKVGMALK